MLTRRAILAASATAAVAIGAGSLRTRAQTLRKTVHIIVGFPAGGATDLIARILADRLRGPYAASVIVENKPGGAHASRSITSKMRNRMAANFCSRPIFRSPSIRTAFAR
jgi:tripartite-type tricarboxylate transporter receptor subunit TctC